MNDPDLGAWSYQYDDSGRLVLQTDALGQKTRLTYDGLARVLTRVARADTGLAETTTFTYDEARAGFYNVGALTTAANAYATIQSNFDNEGRLASKSYVVDGSTYDFAAGYDTGGRILWQTYPDGDSVGSAGNPILYDGAGRAKAVPGLVTGTSYDARGNLTSITRANATVSTLGYSAARGWLTSIQTTAGATTLQNLVYSRDVSDRINGVTSGQVGESWSYGYDDLDRLLTATNTTDALLTQSFTYDRIDNITSNSAIGTYTYPAAGTPRPHAVTGTPLGSYGYDANGNMTSAAGDTLTYDGENRLTGLNAVTFVYGPDGERLKKTGSGGTTLYLGDDVEITGGVMTKYLPGDAKRVGSTTYWMHRDQLGSVQAVTDAAGAIVYRANYRPFGERLTSISLVDEAKGFIGQRLDSETGLMYLHARYYDPALGRFVQADPIGPAGGLNLYAYVNNSPSNSIDPMGLAQIELRLGGYCQSSCGGSDDSSTGGGARGDIGGGADNPGSAAGGLGGVGNPPGNSESGAPAAGVSGIGGGSGGAGAEGVAGGANSGHESGLGRRSDATDGDVAALGVLTSSKFIPVSEVKGLGFIDLTLYEGQSNWRSTSIGHTIRDHVGKSYSYLKQAILDSRHQIQVFNFEVKWGEKSESSFTSLVSANKLVSATLAQNSAIVAQVSRGDIFGASIVGVFYAPTGYEAYATSPRSAIHFRKTTEVKVIVSYHPNYPAHIFVLTAFPFNP